MSMKNSSDTIGNRTCNLLACSAVPQLTASPGAPKVYSYVQEIVVEECGSSEQTYQLNWTQQTAELPYTSSLTNEGS